MDSQSALGIHLNRCVQWELARVRKAVQTTGMFWFVDIPRTSSTSLRVGLGESVGYPHSKENTHGKYQYMRGGSVESSIIGSHVPAFLMRHLLGAEIWDQCFKFSVLREPRQWIYSLFLYVSRYDNLGYRAKTFEDFLREFLVFMKLPLVERVFPGRMIQSEYLVRDGLLDIDILVDFNRRRSILNHLNSLLSVNISGDLVLIQGRSRADQGAADSAVENAWNEIRDQRLLQDIDQILEADYDFYKRCACSADGLYASKEC